MPLFSRAARRSGPLHRVPRAALQQQTLTSSIPTAIKSPSAHNQLLCNLISSPSARTLRVHQLTKQFSTTSTAAYKNMASDNPQDQNNADFQLSEVFNVKDKVALITGGGSGIGLMATQALAVNGAKVYIVGRTEEKLERAAETYGKNASGQIIPITADVGKKESIAQLVKEFQSKEQHLDILINNAGVSSATFQTEASSADEMKKNLFDHESATVEDWLSTYQVNVPQLYFMTTAFLPMLQKATEKTPSWSGTAINITSISGFVKTAQHHFAYNASKAAAAHVTRMLASEVATNGLKVRINAVAPGVFPSEMTANDSGENQKSHIPKDKFASKVPAQRPGNDRDMAGAILFAVTNQYLNGQNVIVDGGYTLAVGM